MERTLVLLLSMFTSLAGILLAWRNHRLQVSATSFDDLTDLVEVYREEIARLTQKSEHLDTKLTTCNERLLEARHEVVVCEERLKIERELFEEQLHQKERKKGA